MTVFISRLPIVTQTLLQMFDAFVMPEDLAPGQVESARRATLREMLKERERHVASPGTDPARPFPQRQWPTLPITMSMREVVVETKVEVPIPTRGARSARRQKPDKSQKAPDKNPQAGNMPLLTSYETLLHRTVIIHRNEVYNDYQQHLIQRTEQFGNYVDALKQEAEAFTEHWMESVRSLNPEPRMLRDAF
jgi:hypothetical protein